MTDWEWYRDTNTCWLFNHFLLTVNFEPSKFMGYNIPAGSRVIGLNALSCQTPLTVSQIRTSLKKLEKSKEITIKTTNKFSIISIVKWSEYQTDDKPIANQSQTDDKPIATSKELNNPRKKEDSNTGDFFENDFETFWKLYPKKRIGSKDKSKAAYLKALKEKRATVEEIKNGVEKYAVSDEATKNGGQFAKGCAAWLNDDRWKSNYDTPTKPARDNSGTTDDRLKARVHDTARFIDDLCGD